MDGIAEGTVKDKKTRTKYIVELSTGEEIEVRLSIKYVLNGMELFVGAKVFVMQTPDSPIKGYVLTATDFKLNGWIGWTDEYEPSYPV